MNNSSSHSTANRSINSLSTGSLRFLFETSTGPSQALTYRESVVVALTTRSYHLPGNKTWRKDWYDYMTNNHPILGICFHHPYHPVKRRMRIVYLIGSMLFGLAITNIIYIAFVFSDADYDKTYAEYRSNSTTTGAEVIDKNVLTLSVTNGNIALWSVGSAVHALFDNLIWALTACTWYVCCRFREWMPFTCACLTSSLTFGFSLYL